MGICLFYFIHTGHKLSWSLFYFHCVLCDYRIYWNEVKLKDNVVLEEKKQLQERKTVNPGIQNPEWRWEGVLTASDSSFKEMYVVWMSSQRHWFEPWEGFGEKWKQNVKSCFTEALRHRTTMSSWKAHARPQAFLVSNSSDGRRDQRHPDPQYAHYRHIRSPLWWSSNSGVWSVPAGDYYGSIYMQWLWNQILGEQVSFAWIMFQGK